MRLKDLYNQRGAIVHGPRDDIPSEDHSLLAGIAKELVRKELGVPYVPDPAHPIGAALAQYEAKMADVVGTHVGAEERAMELEAKATKKIKVVGGGIVGIVGKQVK